MEKDLSKELIEKLEEMNKELKRIAEALSVFKVATIAFIISALAVLFKNFLI